MLYRHARRAFAVVVEPVNDPPTCAAPPTLLARYLAVHLLAPLVGLRVADGEILDRGAADPEARSLLVRVSCASADCRLSIGPSVKPFLALQFVVEPAAGGDAAVDDHAAPEDGGGGGAAVAAIEAYGPQAAWNKLLDGLTYAPGATASRDGIDVLELAANDEAGARCAAHVAVSVQPDFACYSAFSPFF